MQLLRRRAESRKAFLDVACPIAIQDARNPTQVILPHIVQSIRPGGGTAVDGDLGAAGVNEMPVVVNLTGCRDSLEQIPDEVGGLHPHAAAVHGAPAGMVVLVRNATDSPALSISKGWL